MGDVQIYCSTMFSHIASTSNAEADNYMKAEATGQGTVKIFSGQENFKISGHFSRHKTTQTRWKVPLKSSKNTVVTEISNTSALFVSYLQQCHSTSMSFSFQGPQLGLRLTWAGASTRWSWYKCNIPKCNSTCWHLPRMPYIQLVFLQVRWCTIYKRAPKFQDMCKNSGHGVNFKTTPRPGAINLSVARNHQYIFVLLNDQQKNQNCR